ncbi:hypothetical protein [Loktanella sp. SALINAS62]|uniref:hypothetical protein n=1 Tax=Loktanella sp. SALINAS62 TaxID=2706124 RepID=UPI001B8CBC40|nr:hypothetical protein [Loktanella sp. SALINAS62]
MRMKIAVTGLCLIALPATGGPYDGTFKQAANAECDLVGVDGGSVRIADGIFYGVELQCRMSDPVNVLEMDALLYTMECSGDDQMFTERAMVMDKAEDDGIIMVWNGYAFVYDRCDPTPAVTIDTPSTPDDTISSDVAPEN